MFVSYFQTGCGIAAKFSSGIEIIRRLLRVSLIEEFPDESDNRATRVRLTQIVR